MSDPLVDRYRGSFPTNPSRKTHEPLDDSKLRKLSEKIQSTGKHPGVPSPSAATVRFAKLEDPQDWVLPRQAPSSMQQQFQVLKGQELERLAKISTDPVNVQAVEGSTLPSLPPSSMQNQLEILRSQERERWDKIVDELWRAEQREIDILWQQYEKMVTEEYAELATPKASWSAAYNEFEERGGLDLYRSLRPVYYRAKIRQPHKFIMQMVSSNVRLAGVEVRQGVHPKFAKILERVDRSINRSVIAQFGIQPVKYVGCFRPSPLGDRISNHMIGAAIDIDATINSADRNPHLKKPQLEALDEMLAFMAASQNPLAPKPKLTASGSWLAGVPNLDSIDRARALHTQTVAISEEAKAFLDEFLDQWVAFKKGPPQSLGAGRKKDAFQIIEKLAKAFSGQTGLRNLQKGGIISIPLEVFEALASDPDLQSGTQYDTSKDIMHFEVRRVADIVGESGFP